MRSKKLLLVYLIFLSLPVFAQPADMSLIPYRQGNLWGYASPDRKIVIAPVYDDANPFFVGYASVKKGKKYGYINKAGKLVIPFKYFVAKRFRYGYTDNVKTNQPDTVLFAAAALTSAAIERCIDTKGKEMRKCPAINENSIPDNNKPLVKDTIISSFSTMVKSETFDKVVDQYKLPGIEEDYYVAIKDNQYGVINNKFETIAPFEYSSIKKMTINNTVYLVVEKNGVKGMLSGNGSVLLNIVNSRLDYVKANNGKDYFVFLSNGNGGIKDINLQDLVSPIYSDIQYDNSGGFVLTGKNNLKGAYLLNNKTVEAKYSDVNLINNGNFLLIKTQSGKSGYVNSDGVEFFQE